MKVITVRQPWAWAIIHGGKDVENRSRNIVGNYRGPLAIHAGLGWSEEGAADWNVRGALMSDDEGYEVEPDRVWDVADYAQVIDPRFVRGAIIGTVDLVDAHSASVIDGCGRMDHNCPEHGTCRHHCSPWAYGPNPAGGWFQHIVLAKPKPLVKPTPTKGRLGLWSWDEVQS